MTIPGFSRPPVTAIVEYTIVVQCHSGWMGGWPTMQYHLLMMVLAGTLTLFYNASVLRVLLNLKKRHKISIESMFIHVSGMKFHVV